MSLIRFFKYEALSNDIIILDEREPQISNDYGTVAQNMCKRKTSIGADVLSVLSKSDICDYKCRFFNSDGTEAEICGNALRCVSNYCFEKLNSNSKIVRFETVGGILSTQYLGDGLVELKLKQRGGIEEKEIHVENNSFKTHNVNLGNPHAVIFEEKEECDLIIGNLGPKIEHHSSFQPHGTNVHFAYIIDESRVRLRIWERGCGETSSCASGASAVALVSYKLGLVKDRIKVEMEGGDIEISVTKEIKNQGGEEEVEEFSVRQKGKTRFVFTGEIPHDDVSYT